MQKMMIRLDEEKIINEQKYDLDSLHKTLHVFFNQFDFLQLQEPSGSIILQGQNSPRDFGRFGIIVNTLRKQSWFMDNVAEWILFDNDDSADPNFFNEEDLVHYFKLKQLAGG